MADQKFTDLTEKATPADGDIMPIVDNDSTPASKKVTWAHIKSTLKTYFDTLYGNMILASIQSVTGLKTFDKDKIAMKGTSTGVTTISTANTSATDYTATLPAKTGTVAMTTDITDANVGFTDVTTGNASTSAHGFVVKATNPGTANFINVVGLANGETVYKNVQLFDNSALTAEAFGDTSSAGTAIIAARRDHRHAMPAAPTTVTGSAGSLKSTATTGVMAITGPGAGTTRTKTVSDGNDTLMELGAVQSVTGAKTFDSSAAKVKGSSTGVTAIASANASATSYTATLPAKDGTLAYTSDILAPLPLNGFENRTDSSLAFNAGTRVFTVDKTGSGFNIYTNGTVINKTTAQTVTIDNTVGLWYIYFATNGTLTASQTPWVITSDNVPVALLYWNGTAGLLGDERHGAKRDRAWHLWAHDTIGARYESGLSGTFTDTTLSITQGVIHDEDIELDTGGTKTACTLLYRNTGGSTMTFTRSSSTPYKANAGVIQWDNGGTMADADTNKFVCYYVFATNDVAEPIYVVVGQAQHATIALARADTLPTIPNITTREWKLIYRLIYKNAGGTATYQEAADYRSDVSTPAGATATANHNNLAGLQGGTTNEYYHLSSAQATIATQSATAARDGYLTSTDWSTFNGKGDMVLASAQSVTGAKTFDSRAFKMGGESTGVTTFASANAGSSDFTLTFPAETATLDSRTIQVTGITVAKTSWATDGSLQKYQISDSNITASSIVDIIPDNADIGIVNEAQVLPATASESGKVSLWAKVLPTDDFDVTINIKTKA